MTKKIRSFMLGIGGSLDMFGVIPSHNYNINVHLSPIQAYLEDALALSDDWNKVGEDIQKSFISYAYVKEQKKSQRRST